MKFKLLKENIPLSKFNLIEAMEEYDSKGNLLTQEQITYFKNSKVRDNQGRLLVVYHGTNDTFSKVDFKKGAQGLFWFTSNKETITSSGARGTKNILALYADIRNPAGWEEYDKYGISQLEYKGYDGVILPQPDGTIYGFVFRQPSQIKLITNKTPTKSLYMHEGVPEELDLEGKSLPEEQSNFSSLQYLTETSGNNSSSPVQTDSEGNPLSSEQISYFKKSKVRDSSGKLLVCYHGSKKSFTKFDPNKTGKGNDQYGSGFYFTTDYNTALGYTTSDNPNVIKAYINIEKPLIIDGGKNSNLRDFNITNMQAYQIIKLAPNIMDKEESPLGDYIEDYWEVGPKDYMIRQLANGYDWDLMTLEDLFRYNPTAYREALHKVLGYDGIIVNFNDSQFVIAWFPDQIKFYSNKNPTKTHDINEELLEETDSEGNILSKEQIEFFKNSKVRDEKGRLLVIYHGTGRSFTVFRKGDIGFHFGTKAQAEHRSQAWGKDGKTDAYYLNITNPLVLEYDYGSWDGEFLAPRFIRDEVATTPEDIKILKDIEENMYGGAYSSPASTALRNWIKSKGYDGIKYRNSFEGSGNYYSYIAFHPNQIKHISNKNPTKSQNMFEKNCPHSRGFSHELGQQK